MSIHTCSSPSSHRSSSCRLEPSLNVRRTSLTQPPMGHALRCAKRITLTCVATRNDRKIHAPARSCRVAHDLPASSWPPTVGSLLSYTLSQPYLYACLHICLHTCLCTSRAALSAGLTHQRTSSSPRMSPLLRAGCRFSPLVMPSA